jgi:hypothetical protein
MRLAAVQGLLTLLLALSSPVLAAEVELLELETLGIPSSSDRTEARRISELRLHAGRLYVGTGDAVVNTGPADVISLDLATGKFAREFTVDDEAVYRYRVLDGRLVVPGPDATESWDFGNVYVREESGWTKHRTLPRAVHVNDVLAHGGLWFATTGTWVELPEGTRFFTGAIFASADRGATWHPEYISPAYANRVYRVDSLVVFRNRLCAFSYAFHTVPADSVPDDVRESAGTPQTQGGVEWINLYLPDPQGPVDAQIRARTGWRPADFVPGENVCRVRPFVFRDRLLLGVTRGRTVAPFASYRVDGPEAVPGARFELYAFDGERSERVPAPCDSLLDVHVGEDLLTLLVAHDGHHWIVETPDLVEWRRLALPLDRGRPLAIERDGETIWVGTKDGSLFRSAGVRKLPSEDAIAGAGPASFSLRAELPREGHRYGAAITRWSDPGHPASLAWRLLDGETILLATTNVAECRLFIPPGLREKPGLCVSVNGKLVWKLPPEGPREEVVCSRASDGAWTLRASEGSSGLFAPVPQRVGEAAEDFGRIDAGLGQWAAEALRSRTGAELALVPASAFRTGLARGPVAMQDLYDLCHRDRVAVLRLTGQDLVALLSQNLARDARTRCAAAGFTATYDPDTGDLGVHSLKPMREYAVAMPRYAATHGERFFGRALGDHEEWGHLHTALVEHLEATGKIERSAPSLTPVK